MLLKLIDFLQTNKFLHFFTNSFLLFNFRTKKGGKNKLLGYLSGLSIKSSVKLKGRSNTVEFKSGYRLDKSKIYVRGNNNKIIINENSKVISSLIWIIGDNNVLTLGQDNVVYNTEIGLEYSDNKIKTHKKVLIGGFVQLGRIKNNTSMVCIYACEGKKIELQKGVCVSDGVCMRTSDSHPIYNNTGERINYPEDINVGENVWIGSKASLLKGAGVGDNSIIAYRGLVTKDFSDNSNVILAGSPAKILKEEIKWELFF